MCVLKFVTLRN